LEKIEKKNLFISEEWINKTKEYCIGSTEVYETCYDNIKDLYLSLQKQYGECVSFILDFTDPKPHSKKIGWVFQEEGTYEGTGESFIQETWVTVHNSLPKKTVKYDYYFLK
jgi:hypothetical protein